MALGLPSVASAKDATPAASRSVEASIPFANHGGIRNWQVTGRDTLYIQDSSNHWYKASLMGPCLNLPFAETLGFKSNPDGSFDRFSSVFTGHQQCQLTSLTASAPPVSARKAARKPS